MNSIRSTGLRWVLACAALAGGAGAAHAGSDVYWSLGVSPAPGVSIGVGNVAPVYVRPAPIYVQPAPVYVQPAPIYAHPPVVYSPPRVVYGTPGYYVQPAPVIHGWHPGPQFHGRPHRHGHGHKHPHRGGGRGHGHGHGHHRR
ncbi:hypothetical protein WG922_13025 [Ramlibacter sp. AN1015]|uniref:hypothetical protein n=1 Tax=Ramlibacter sp. AN1015 TaxID=3133428 RepID=UPI0030C03FCA